MPRPLKETLEALLERRDLSEQEAHELLVALTDPEMAPPMAGALLAALRAKGVVADEVRGFARGMRSLARHPRIPPGAPHISPSSISWARYRHRTAPDLGSSASRRW